MKKQIAIGLIFLLSSFYAIAQDTLQAVKVETNRKSLKKSYSLTANTTLLTNHHGSRLISRVKLGIHT